MNRKKKIWVADDDQSISWVIERALTKQGYDVSVFPGAEELLRILPDSSPDLIISDIRMPGLSGFELLQEIHRASAEIPVIIITAFGDLDSAVDSYQYGAFEYLVKPFDINELLSIVKKSFEIDSGREETAKSSFRDELTLLGDSPPIQAVFRMIGRLSSSSMGVLIRGESGTGKELIARAIHQTSLRKHQPLVSINTAAIPAELLESELFGHEKGAFTGAVHRHIGRFEQAHEGTLFLDEIGDMPAALQTRLLRVLSEGCFYRVGGREEISVDVRIIAATNQHLETLVANGNFRNDLFHRLNVITLMIPPLRERGGDLALLTNYFLGKAGQELGVEEKQCHEEVMDRIRSYHWPGNVRELENLAYRLTVLTPGKQIVLSDLPEEITSVSPEGQASNKWQNLLRQEAEKEIGKGHTGLVQTMGDEFERILVKAALEHTEGHKINAAEILGWGRNTLTRKLKNWKRFF